MAEPESASHDAHTLSEGTETAGLILFTLVSAAASLLVFEWPIYARLLAPSDLPLGPLDHLLIAWTIWSKSIVFLIPTLIVALALERFGYVRAAWSCQAIACVLVYAFIGWDALIYRAYGQHLLSLTAFIGQPEAADFIGGFTRWLWTPAVCLAVTSGATMCLLLLSRLCAAEVRQAWGASRGVSVVGFLAVLVLAPLALKNYTLRGLLFERTAALFPVDLRPTSSLYKPLPFNDPVLEALDRDLRRAYRESFVRMMQPLAPDLSAVFDGRDKPNVILIVLESLNYEEAVLKGGMPKLVQWGKGGMALERHYSGSNHSEPGLFTLLYSRPPWDYFVTLDAGVPPQMCETFRKSGYRTAYLSGANSNWLRMADFVNEQSFDLCAEGGWAAQQFNLWDVETLAELRRVIAEPEAPPLLALVYLMSSHLPYPFPAEYQNILIDGRKYDEKGPPLDHYHRALRFLDDQIASLLSGLEPGRNIVVVTGDHGESIEHDGTVGHYTGFSDAQTRVPMFIVGPGVPATRIETLTTHADILPTLLHILSGQEVKITGSTGRNLLTGNTSEQTVLFTIHPDGRLHLLAVRGEHRLAFNADSRSPQLRVLGFQDALGRPKVLHGQSPEDITHWVDLVRQQMR